MSLVHHKGSPYWYMDFQINGKKVFRSTKTSNKVLARKIEQSTKDQIVTKMKLGQEAIAISLEDALDLYIDSLTGRSCHSTYVSTRNVILGKQNPNCTRKIKARYSLDSIQEIHTIKTSDIERYVTQRKKEKCAPATIKHQLGVLRATFRFARRHGYLVSDIIEFPLVKQPKTEIVFLTEDEEARLIEALKPDRIVQGYAAPENRECTTLQDQQDIVVLLLDTGMRAMEMFKIEWKNVDLENGELFYHSFKADKRQTAFLTDRAIDVLQRRFESKRPDQQYVFENIDKTTHRKYNLGWLKRAVIRSKINKRVTFHKLRSSYASKLVQNGVSLMEVGQLLNHTNPTTTAIYATLVPSQASKKAASVLNGLRK